MRVQRTESECIMDQPHITKFTVEQYRCRGCKRTESECVMDQPHITKFTVEQYRCRGCTNIAPKMAKPLSRTLVSISITQYKYCFEAEIQIVINITNQSIIGYN